MKNILLSIGFIFIFINSCTTVPRPVDINTSNVFHYEYDKVWNATYEVLKEQNYKIEEMHKDKGLIKTDYVRTGLDHILEIAWFPLIRIFYNDGIYKMDVSIEKTNQSSKVIIKLKPEAYNSLFGARQWDTGESKGLVEESLFNRISTILKGSN